MAAEVRHVGQHRIGRVEQRDVLAIDFRRRRGTIGLRGDGIVERVEADEAVRRAQGLQGIAMGNGLRTEDIGTGEIEAQGHGRGRNENMAAQDNARPAPCA